MISREQALKIARQESLKLAAMPEYAARRYESAAFYRETKAAFVYFAACPELQAQDYAPGGFFIYVDKTDGHVWKSSEIEKSLTAAAERKTPQAA